MLYAITGTDSPDSLPRRVAARTAHLARVRQLLDEGRLVIAGPHPNLDTNDPGGAGYSGSLIVAEFDSLADAESWAGADPYVAGGAWVDVSVKPFVQVMP
ncbi:MAG: YciI family protein [Chromatiales bacterium]|nr:MAG: YciI family protein [Chromatiales bacterium]